MVNAMVQPILKEELVPDGRYIYGFRGSEGIF